MLAHILARIWFADLHTDGKPYRLRGQNDGHSSTQKKLKLLLNKKSLYQNDVYDVRQHITKCMVLGNTLQSVWC